MLGAIDETTEELVSSQDSTDLSRTEGLLAPRNNSLVRRGVSEQWTNCQHVWVGVCGGIHRVALTKLCVGGGGKEIQFLAINFSQYLLCSFLSPAPPLSHPHPPLSHLAPPWPHLCPSKSKQRSHSEGALLDEGRAASDLAAKLYSLDGFQKSTVAKHLSVR